MIDQNILITGLGAIAGSGILGTVAASVLAFDWRAKAKRARAEVKSAHLQAAIDRQHKLDWIGRYEGAAADVLSLTDQLKLASAFPAPEPEPQPSWQRPRDAKGHFIKAGAAVAG